MSSDPDKSMSGMLGEGAGLRDDIDPNLEAVDENLEEAVEEKNNVKAKPLILIGQKSKKSVGTEWIETILIRCHRCGTAKNEEDKGKFIQINEFIAWFHNEECHDLWLETANDFKTGAVLDDYGKEI